MYNLTTQYVLVIHYSPIHYKDDCIRLFTGTFNSEVFKSFFQNYSVNAAYTNVAYEPCKKFFDTIITNLSVNTNLHNYIGIQYKNNINCFCNSKLQYIKSNYINVYVEYWIQSIEPIMYSYYMMTLNNTDLSFYFNKFTNLNKNYNICNNNNYYYNFIIKFDNLYSACVSADMTAVITKFDELYTIYLSSINKISNDSSSMTFEKSKSNVASVNKIIDTAPSSVLSTDVTHSSIQNNPAKSINYYDYYYQKSIDNNYNYSYSPSTKIYYPEPFVASPTFVHNDIWFLHIIVYHYWLWFFFIFIIIFFFLTAFCTARWCAMRNKPRKETRGFSRSKCGDLITGLVPAAWATTIVVHESIDSSDWDDGVGTIEMTMAIRAYQWGWEYWYPRSLHLYPTDHKYEPTLFGHNTFNYNYESQIRKKYINEYMSVKSDNILLTASNVLNTLDDTYSVQKLKCTVSDNTTRKLKYHNYTRPRHKIFLEGDSTAPLNSNNSVNFNYIIDVYNKYYMNNAVTSQSPFDFYSTINLFNKQVDFIDYKSLQQTTKFSDHLINKYYLNNFYLAHTNLSFYKYLYKSFFTNNNLNYLNTNMGSNSLSGNYYEVYKNIDFNYWEYPKLELLDYNIYVNVENNINKYFEFIQPDLKFINILFISQKRFPYLYNKYIDNFSTLPYKCKSYRKYNSVGLYDINNKLNLSKYNIPDKIFNTNLLTYKDIFQTPDYLQFGDIFEEKYAFLNLSDYFWDQLENTYLSECNTINLIENPTVLNNPIRFNSIAYEFIYNNFYQFKNVQFTKLSSPKWNINYLISNFYLNTQNYYSYINNYYEELLNIFDSTLSNIMANHNINTLNFTQKYNSLIPTTDVNTVKSKLNLYSDLSGYFKEYYNFIKAYYNWYEYTDSYLYPRLFSNTFNNINNSRKLISIKPLLNKTTLTFLKTNFNHSNLKILPIKNLMWYKSNNTLFFNFNFKDSKEFTLMQSKWRCIFYNYFKIEISKPRNLIITPLGKYAKPTYIINYANLNNNSYNNIAYKNFNNLYTRIFYEKKNITPPNFSNYRLEYLINYKYNMHLLNRNNNNIIFYNQLNFKSFKYLISQFKLTKSGHNNYELNTVKKTYYSIKPLINNKNNNIIHFTTNFNKNSNRNIFTSKNSKGGLFNYIYKVNDLYVKYNFISTSYANSLNFNYINNLKLVKEISTNYSNILLSSLLNDKSYIKFYKFSNNKLNLTSNLLQNNNNLNINWIDTLKYTLYLNSTNITNINLNAINITNINLNAINTTNINLNAISTTNTNMTLDFKNININPINFKNINININFKNININPINFKNINTTHINFKNINTTHINFKNINTTHINFKNINTTHINFKNINTTHINFKNIKISYKLNAIYHHTWNYKNMISLSHIAWSYKLRNCCIITAMRRCNKPFSIYYLMLFNPKFPQLSSLGGIKFRKYNMNFTNLFIKLIHKPFYTISITQLNNIQLNKFIIQYKYFTWYNAWISIQIINLVNKFGNKFNSIQCNLLYTKHIRAWSCYAMTVRVIYVWQNNKLVKTVLLTPKALSTPLPLHNINLNNINLNNIKVNDLRLNSITTNISQFTYLMNYIVLLNYYKSNPVAYKNHINSINLNSINLNSINLNSINLNSINLNSINLNSINLNSINLNSINLNSINLNSINLNSINLNSINLNSINLNNINLNNINLNNINLNNINLNNINLNNINLNNINLNNINLNNINLNNINLNNINLNNINLNNINLNNINLNNINLNNINLLFFSNNSTSPYIPIKRGFNNLYKSITQNVTAIPVGVRMHFVTTSKDIIHSWAIPSAGIKIDCIPGFCSHRIICFWSAGMFWGQCMEICGRYHHWMPILIYFLHRDLFILWCNHFMFYKNELNFLRKYDKSLVSTHSTSKYNQNSWLSEYIIN